LARDEGEPSLRKVGWRLPVDVKAQVAYEATLSDAREETTAADLIRLGYAIRSTLRHWFSTKATLPESVRKGWEEADIYLQKLTLGLMKKFDPKALLAILMAQAASDPSMMEELAKDGEFRNVINLWMEGWVKALEKAEGQQAEEG
jgi:hypothetical protein